MHYNLSCFPILDKIYKARHELLNITTPAVTPEIPTTYFSPTDPEQELSNYFKLLMSNYPDGTLTPISNGFASTFDQIHHKFHMPPQQQHQQQQTQIGRMQQPQERFYLQQLQQQAQNLQIQQQIQQHQQQQRNAFLSPYFVSDGSLKTHQNTGNNATENHNTSANTSGYHSYSSSTTSLELMYPPYQPLSAAAIAAATATSLQQQHQLKQMQQLQQHQQQQQTQHHQQQQQQQIQQQHPETPKIKLDYSPNLSQYLGSSSRLLNLSSSSVLSDGEITPTPTFEMPVSYYWSVQNIKLLAKHLCIIVLLDVLRI